MYSLVRVRGVSGLRLALLAAIAVCAAGVFLPASVASESAANPIQSENSRPGTRAWQTPDGDGVAIDGYASEVSALPGDTLHFHVGTRPAAPYHVEIYRLGWYGGAGARRLACIPADCTSTKPGRPQPNGTPGAGGIVQAGWPVTDQLKIPADWTTGYLMVRFLLRSGQAWTTYVILRDPPARHSEILVQVPVNTWQAYNGWGGMSLYEFDYAHGQRANHVSFDRPYAWKLQGGQSPLVWEVQTIRFLERMGYDLSYQTDVDTHRNPGSLLEHRLVLVNGHDEYWTKQIFDAFEGARNRGTNLAFMGANAAYWQVRYDDDERTIVGYKSFSDPIPDPALKTVRFRELTPPRFECTLIGIQHQGAVLDWPPGDYTVQAAALGDAWMKGSGFKAGDVLSDTVSVESDTIPGNQSAASSCTHALTVFFHRERGGDKDGNADAIRYTDQSGARVFASGSHQWSWALDSFRYGSGSGGAADARAQRFMTNALDDLTRPAPPVSVTASLGRRGVVLAASLHADPRVSAVRFMRRAGGPVACSGAAGCVDRPPGHRTYVYQAVAVDPWRASSPTAATAVHVPNAPPLLRLSGPRLVRRGSVHSYRAAVSDRDQDRVLVGWRVAGERVGTGTGVDVRFDRSGRVRIAASADDRHGGRTRATLTVRVR
jgi:hypothetical protein